MAVVDCSSSAPVATDAGLDGEAADVAIDACGDGNGLVALATGQFHPGFIAVGGGSVYWAANSSIMKRSTDECGGPPSTFATWDPQALQADSANVYFTPRSSPLVMQCPANDCSQPITLSIEDSVPPSIAVDATSVYWGSTTTNGSPMTSTIKRCAIGGCAQAPTALVSYANSFMIPCIAVDGANLYWGDNNGDVMSCPISGCTTPSILASGQTPTAIAADGKNVYWVASGNPGAVMKCAVGGCAQSPTTLASGARPGNVLAVDGVNVYWLDAPNVVKCSVDGCAGSPTVTASGQNGPLGPVLDATSLYWTTMDGNVMKLTPK